MLKSLDEEMLGHVDILKIKKLFDATNNDKENVFDVKLIEEVNANLKIWTCVSSLQIVTFH